MPRHSRRCISCSFRGRSRRPWRSSSPFSSRSPFQEIGNESEAELLALLGVELGPCKIALGDGGRYRASIIRDSQDIIIVSSLQMVGVHEISVQALVSGPDSGK